MFVPAADKDSVRPFHGLTWVLEREGGKPNMIVSKLTLPRVLRLPALTLKRTVRKHRLQRENAPNLVSQVEKMMSFNVGLMFNDTERGS